jgi:hypothetical protein
VRGLSSEFSQRGGLVPAWRPPQQTCISIDGSACTGISSMGPSSVLLGQNELELHAAVWCGVEGLQHRASAKSCKLQQA